MGICVIRAHDLPAFRRDARTIHEGVSRCSSSFSRVSQTGEGDKKRLTLTRRLELKAGKLYRVMLKFSLVVGVSLTSTAIAQLAPVAGTHCAALPANLGRLRSPCALCLAQSLKQLSFFVRYVSVACLLRVEDS